jgi:hypothetical protein
MSYFGGNAAGYEAGDLSISMAYTSDDPSKAHEWQRLEKPVLTATDKDTRWWENRKLFKSTVIQDPQKHLGHEFVMYYNANGDSAVNNKRLVGMSALVWQFLMIWFHGSEYKKSL